MAGIEQLKEEVGGLMKDVPPHHGWEHAEEVSRFAKLLGYMESADLNSSRVVGLLHDLRKRDDEELRVRKIRVSWGEKASQTDARGMVRKHRKEIYFGDDLQIRNFWFKVDIGSE